MEKRPLLLFFALFCAFGALIVGIAFLFLSLPPASSSGESDTPLSFRERWTLNRPSDTSQNNTGTEDVSDASGGEEDTSSGSSSGDSSSGDTGSSDTSSGSSGGGAFSEPLVRSLALSGEVRVPLTNGSGLAFSDVPLTLHYVGGEVTVTRWESGSTSSTRVASSGGDGTITAAGNTVLVVWVDLRSRDVQAAWSTDYGRTFGAPTTLGTIGRGSATPSACLTSDDVAWVVWSNMAVPASTGPLMFASGTVEDWKSTTALGYDYVTAPSVACHNDTVYVTWRNQPEGTVAEAPVATLSRSGFSLVTTLSSAYDPTIAFCGDEVWIGYHDAIGATWRTSLSGTSVKLDDTAKFVSSACASDAAAFAWADYPDKATTHAPTTPSAQAVRKLPVSVLFNGEVISLDPAEGAGDSGPASLIFGPDGTLYVSWRTTGAVMLAEYARLE